MSEIRVGVPANVDRIVRLSLLRAQVNAALGLPLEVGADPFGTCVALGVEIDPCGVRWKAFA